MIKVGKRISLLRNYKNLNSYEKSKVAEGGEYNLSGERYRKNIRISSAFPFFAIGEICTVNPRKSELSEFPLDTKVSFVPMADLNENRIAFIAKQYRILSEVGTSYTYFADNDVLLAKVTPCFENGKAGIAKNLKNGIGFGSSEFYVLRSSERVLPEWIYFCVIHPLFRQSGINNMTGTGGLQRVPRKFIEDYEIPLPPLEIQREIVSEIEGYQKVIDGARAVVENYRPQIAVDPEWPMVELREVFQLSSGRGLAQAQMKGGPFPVYGGNGISGFHSEYFVDEPIIVIGRVGAYCGAVHITDPKAWVTDNGLYITKYKRKVNQHFLAQVLTQLDLNQFAKVGGQPSISQTTVYECKVPLPSLETQQSIVAEIEAEQELVDANWELIERFEKKIQDTVGRVWDGVIDY